MEVDKRIVELEVKFATLEAQHVNLHEDIRDLTSEVKQLRNELTKGKGVFIGMFMVIGAAYTLIYNFFIK